jgi:hypothetical protein
MTSNCHRPYSLLLIVLLQSNCSRRLFLLGCRDGCMRLGTGCKGCSGWYDSKSTMIWGYYKAVVTALRWFFCLLGCMTAIVIILHNDRSLLHFVWFCCSLQALGCCSARTLLPLSWPSSALMLSGSLSWLRLMLSWQPLCRGMLLSWTLHFTPSQQYRISACGS